jgi:Chromo (CHRromatin Organisation MOdifier) domain
LPETLRTHYTAIAVFVDRLTKMVHLVPTFNELTAEQFARLFMENIVRLHGMPEEIVSDRDKLFTSEFWTQLCNVYGIQKAMSTAFHPQSDGQTERVNRVLEDTIRHYINPQQDNWDELLPCVEFTINNAKHSVTRMTPFQLNYGINPRSPAMVNFLSKGVAHTAQDEHTLENGRKIMRRLVKEEDMLPAALRFTQEMQQAMNEVRDLFKAAQDRAKAYADTKRTVAVPFKVGDMVLVKADNLNLKHAGCRKFSARKVGPFLVEKAIGHVAFKLKLPDNFKCHPVFHASQLETYVPGRTPPPPPPELINGEWEYEVETIVDHQLRNLGGRRARNPDGSFGPPNTRDYYLIKWRGQTAEHNSWEPVQNLENAHEAISEFWERRKGHKKPLGFRRKPRPAAT